MAKSKTFAPFTDSEIHRLRRVENDRRVAYCGNARRRIALLLACMAGVAACDVDRPLNHFVVPSGYRGPVVVISHPDFEDLDRTQETEEGYVHLVSDTAVVCVASDRAFEGYRLSAEYEDGSPILRRQILLSQFQPDPTSSSITIAALGVWGGGAKDVNMLWFAVGTQDEVAALLRVYALGAIASRMPDGVNINQLTDFRQFGRYCAGDQ